MTEQPRRLVLLQAAAAIGLLVTQPAYSQTVCADKETEEESDICRASILKKDQQLDYSKITGKRGGNTTGGVPVSVLDNEYGRSTVDLAGKIDAYFTLDVYDKQRIPLIKSLKGDATSWVSKYARGGSVRSKSARTMYNALDAITGHLASNGLAPFPAGKMKAVRANVDQALDFLAEGN